MTARYQCSLENIRCALITRIQAHDSFIGIITKSIPKMSLPFVHFLTESYAGHNESSLLPRCLGRQISSRLLKLDMIHRLFRGQLVVEEGIEEVHSVLHIGARLADGMPTIHP